MLSEYAVSFTSDQCFWERVGDSVFLPTANAAAEVGGAALAAGAGAALAARYVRLSGGNRSAAESFCPNAL